MQALQSGRWPNAAEYQISVGIPEATREALFLRWAKTSEHSGPLYLSRELRSSVLRRGFRLAAARGQVEIVRSLAEKHLELVDGCAALRLAALHGHVEVVKYLLTHEYDAFDATGFGKEALRFAHQNGHAAVLAVLLADPRFARSLRDDSALSQLFERARAELRTT